MMTMTSAEFRATREYLGLPAQWLADHLDVSGRAVRKWDSGEAPVPAGVAAELQQLATFTEDFIAKSADECEEMPDPRVFRIPRTLRDLDTMTPRSSFPLDWWRGVGARLMSRVEGIRLDWID